MKPEKQIDQIDELRFFKMAAKMSKKGLDMFRHIFDEEGKQTLEPSDIVRLRDVLQTTRKNALRVLKEEKSKRKRK